MLIRSTFLSQDCVRLIGLAPLFTDNEDPEGLLVWDSRAAGERPRWCLNKDMMYLSRDCASVALRLRYSGGQCILIK